MAAARAPSPCCWSRSRSLLAHNIAANLEARQIKSGFDFLHDPAGFNIGELLFDYTSRDSYLRAFAVGMANTLRVALAGIVLASVLGVARRPDAPVARTRCCAGWARRTSRCSATCRC